MTASRDDLEVPIARCRRCGNDVPQYELTNDLCFQCQIEDQKRKNKRKEYAHEMDDRQPRGD